MICIYCNDPNEESVSDIIPTTLGRGPILEGSVCKRCNNRINKEIEEPMKEKMSVIRNFLNLTGRRGKRPRIDVKVQFFGRTLHIRIRDPRDLDSRSFIFAKFTDQNGGSKGIVFIAPTGQDLENITKAYRKRHPNAKCERVSADVLDKHTKYQIDFDLGFLADPICLRLAAKVALEWWCKQRSPEDIKTPDFEPIARYIIEGVEPERRCVSIVKSPSILSIFSRVPFGIHSLLIATDPRNTNLVVVVGLFSWVFYKVILNRRHPIATFEELTLINPQSGYVYTPIIRGSLYSGLNIFNDTRADLENPLNVIRRMTPQLKDRLNRGLPSIEKYDGGL